MKTPRLALAIAALLPAMPAAAQDLSPAAIRAAAACAPVGTAAPSKAPRVRALEARAKTLFNTGDRVAIDAGAGDGIQPGQRFYIRRAMEFPGAPRAQHTAGWLRILEVKDSSATAVIDFTCDAVEVGDQLEPYSDVVLPPGVDRTDATGTPDFSRPGKVLYGTEGRQTGGGRDFMLADIGQDKGVTPGARYAVYRSGNVSTDWPVGFAEAVVVSVYADKSVLRVTSAREEVATGDTVVPRIGGTGLATSAAAVGGSGSGEPAPGDAQAPRQGGGEGSAPGAGVVVENAPQQLQSLTFEDLYFDFDRVTLRSEALTQLDQVVKSLDEDPALRIEIEGHTCNIGTAEYNLVLGERRANVVRDYLVAHGVAASRLTAVSYGEEKPKYDNANEETRRLNRRAALVVNVQRATTTADGRSTTPDPETGSSR
jgi:outer membrane protein OmpA-like peptidoglycan-associated protein